MDSGRPKRVEGFEISEFEDAFMAFQPGKDRVHYLNNTALLVLELCTGEHSVPEIASLVQSAFGLDVLPEKEVDQILTSMMDAELVVFQKQGE
jgi:hypothetical protein